MKYDHKLDETLVLKGMMNTRDIHLVIKGHKFMTNLDNEQFIKQLQHHLKYTLRYI